MSDLRKIVENILVTCLGCPGCGRFGLYLESAHSEHTQGWAKLTCPYCSHTERRPIREPKFEAGPVVAAVSDSTEESKKAAEKAVKEITQAAEGKRLEYEHNPLLTEVKKGV